MKQEFEMLREEMDDIIKINKDQMPVMLIGDVSVGMDLAEKINAYWTGLGKKYGFDKDTVEPSGKGNLYFLAEAKHIKTSEELSIEKFNSIEKIVEQLEGCHYECEGGSLEQNTAFIALKKMRRE